MSSAFRGFDEILFDNIDEDPEGVIGAEETTSGEHPQKEEGETVEMDLPESLPILPLRGLVVYPQTAVPLTIGQPRSIRLVDDVVSGKRLIGLVASKDAELDTPGPDDLYQVGTLFRQHH